MKNRIRRANNRMSPEMPSSRLVPVRKPVSVQLPGGTNHKPPGECQQSSICRCKTKFRGSTLVPRRRPRRIAARSRCVPYIDFTAEAPTLKRQLEHARSRQHALDRAGHRCSEEYTALAREIEGLVALVTPSRSLRRPKNAKAFKAIVPWLCPLHGTG